MVLKVITLLGELAMGLSVAWSWIGLPNTWPWRGADDDHSRKASEASATPARAQYDGQQVQKTVEFWERREKKDPRGAIARRNLAGAYLCGHAKPGELRMRSLPSDQPDRHWNSCPVPMPWHSTNWPPRS